jgi:hypothetical protein
MTLSGDYRWLVQAVGSATLSGRPWDPYSEPRLTLKDKRGDRSKGIPPTVRIDVRCLREDLNIAGLETKDETLWQKIRERSGFKNRLAAAESYIRDRLLREGLSVGRIEDPFGELLIATTTAHDE